ncbi:MAG: YdcF family protein [Acidobacteriota bacterium]|nr:YdcF family protein [Acidobacteriota bacterium]
MLAAFSTRILWGMGAILVNSQSPEKADIIVVLGGDYPGGRLRKAMQLVQQGYAPRILISGPLMIYGVHERDLAVQYALAHGMRPDQVIPFESHDLSTADEVRHIVPRLREMGVRTYLVVTSTFHTGRAHRLFHRAAPELEMHTVASPDRAYWCNGYWWTTRECRKTWLLEATKNVTSLF